MTIKTRQLQINGMHCLGCEETINEAVKALPGMYYMAILVALILNNVKD